MADRSLSFDVAAIDHTGKALEKVALRLDRLAEKLDRIDHKRVNVKVDVDTDKASGKMGRFIGGFTKNLNIASKFATARATLITGVIAAALLALPPVATLAAGGIVLALGGAIAGVGLAFAAQNKKVKASFKDLKQDVVKTMREISKPFQQTLLDISGQIGRTFDFFVPTLRRTFRRLAPVVSTFSGQFFDSLKQLQPVIKPVTDAFIALLNALGPALPGIMKGIADGIISVANSISAQPQTFVGIVKFLGNLVEFGLKAIAALSRLNTWLSGPGRSQFEAALLGWTSSVLEFAGQILLALGTMIQGFATFSSKSLYFSAIVARAMGKQGLADVLFKASASVGKFGRIVGGSLTDAAHQVDKWDTKVKHMQKTVKLDAKIDELQRKLTVAERRLSNPNLTKTRKAKIEAHIAQLEAAVRRAQARLDSLHGRDIYIRTHVTYDEIGTPFLPLRRAVGGPVTEQRPYIVGEHGPELFVPRQSGAIVPNHQMTSTTQNEVAGSGMAKPIVLELRSSGTRTDDMLLDLLRRAIRVRGGDVQVVLGRG